MLALQVQNYFIDVMVTPVPKPECHVYGLAKMESALNMSDEVRPKGRKPILDGAHPFPWLHHILM